MIRKAAWILYSIVLTGAFAQQAPAQNRAPDFYRDGYSMQAFHQFRPDSIDFGNWQFAPLPHPCPDVFRYVESPDPMETGYAQNLNWRFGLCAHPGLGTGADPHCGQISPYSYSAAAMSTKAEYGYGYYEWDLTMPEDSLVALEFGLINQDGDKVSLVLGNGTQAYLQLTAGNSLEVEQKRMTLKELFDSTFVSNSIQTLAIEYTPERIRVYMNKRELEDMGIGGWFEGDGIPQQTMVLFQRPVPGDAMPAYLQSGQELQAGCVSVLGMRIYADSSGYKPMIVKQAGKLPPVGRSGLPITIHMNWVRLQEQSQFYPSDIKVHVQKSDDYEIINNNTIVIDEDYRGLLHVPIKVSDGVNESGVFELKINVSK